MTETFGSFADRLARLEQQISGAALRKVMDGIGVDAKKMAAAEASKDLGGDAQFSGWAPTLDTRYEHKGEGQILFMPTRRSAGPWTVAESGRNQGNSGGFSGPGVNRSTGLTARTKSGGLRKVRAVAGRRWNGVTAGKGTATRVIARLDDDAERAVSKHVQTVVAKFWT